MSSTGKRRFAVVVAGAALVIIIVAFVSPLSPVGAGQPAPATDFVRTAGTSFTVAGQPFFPTGVNNHYLTSGTQTEVVRVLDDAVAMGANVVRTYLQPVIGSPDGSVPTIWDWKSAAMSSDLGTHGTYLLYWDKAAGKMAIHDGPDGMEKVDFLIAEAARRHLRLIIALLDFWSYTGGAQQMRSWYGSTDRNTFFFADRRTESDYRAWAHYVLNRVNTRTGVRYKDDPTIMAWELMNEPNAASEKLRMRWTAEMAAYLKSEDPNHLVSSGHANVTSRLADLAIPGIDFGTWHGYPLFYKLGVGEFDRLISKFCSLAAARQKPVLLEEFGYARSNPDQVAAYRRWLDTLTRDRNCGGWLVWRLVSKQENGQFPADEYDQFDVRNDNGPLWNVLKTAAAEGAATRGAGSDPSIVMSAGARTMP